MYKGKVLKHNGISVKPRNRMLNGAPMKLVFLVMVTIVAGAVLLGVAFAAPPAGPSVIVEGNVKEIFTVDWPTISGTWLIDPENSDNAFPKDVVSLKVKTNNNRGWSVSIRDSKLDKPGYLTRYSDSKYDANTFIKNQPQVKVDNGEKKTITGTPAPIISGGKTIQAGETHTIQLFAQGDWSDKLFEDATTNPIKYKIELEFTAGYSP